MVRDEMKNFNELMGLFDHEDLRDEESIMIRIVRYTSFMRENNRKISLSSLKTILDNRLYDIFDAYFLSYCHKDNKSCFLYYAPRDNVSYQMIIDSKTYEVLEINISKVNDALILNTVA
ncbi:MAG: hypothetical protein ACI4NI_01165 [Candidatus Ornithospirochaeta sp.]